MAQRGRLEDQRGTEIKFEMPEFLKRGTVRNFIFNVIQVHFNITSFYTISLALNLQLLAHFCKVLQN